MGTKRKGQRRNAAVGLFERARRELAKGNVKPALKDAKLCFRNDPSPQCRQLLEEAYLGRVQQLRTMRLFGDARAILSELIQLKPTVRAVCEQIPRLQVLLGEQNEESARLLESDPMLLTEIADEAVLDSRCAVPDRPPVKTQVDQVREALAAAERGDDEAAAQLVAPIPRNSPLCDWKLFVRGLSAFYHRDETRVQENWRRLDPNRPAFRIAQTLLAATRQQTAEDKPVDVTAGVRRLERSLQPDPAVDWLRRLSSHWQRNEWTDFFGEYRQGRQRFAKSHTGLLESIVDVVWKRAVREDEFSMLQDIMRIGPAPPLDPHWHRAQAMMAERHGDYEVSPVVEHWAAYAEELARLEYLPENERPIAAGMVYLHLARQYVRYAQDNEHLNLLRPENQDDESVEQFRHEAARCYRKSIEYCEQLAAAYHELARLHQEQNESAKGAAVLQRLIREKPDDFEAHAWLANHYLSNDEPDKSEPHVNAALRLKPRDERTLGLRWYQRLTAIRCLVKNRQLETARREVDEAAQHVPAGIEPYFIDILRASVDLKADNKVAAEQHLAAAFSKVNDPTPIFAHMSCMAARYGLPREVKKDFDDRFKDKIKQRPTSETAGRLARFLLMLHSAQINYTGRSTQERLFLKYLNRTRRTSWQQRDLEDVCDFLSRFPREKVLRERLLIHGVKRFSDSAALQLLAGELEMETGPIFCNYHKAHQHMERALELARKSGKPQHELLAERAQQALAILDTKGSASADGMFDEDERWFDDDDEDSDYEEAVDSLDEELDQTFGRMSGGMSHQQAFAEMQRSMPPVFADLLQRIAQEMGLPPEVILRDIVEHDLPNVPIRPAGRKSSSRRAKRRGR